MRALGCWLYEWQTLVAGLVAGMLALLAAFIAAWPVWRQIRSLRIQTAMITRDNLTTRITAMESRRDTTWKRIDGITSDFMRGIYPDHDDDEDEAKPNVNPGWAHETEKIVNEVVAALTAHQEASLDGELIDTKRRATIQQAKELSDCLSDIHTPFSQDLHAYPELNYTEEQIAAAETASEAAAARAEGNLKLHFLVVRKSGTELDAAFKDSLERLRDRIRQIDRQ